MENAITNDLRIIVENELNQKCLNIEKNSESTDGNVYVIECIDKKYIAKIYDDRNHADSMTMLHTFLSPLLRIPQIIYTNLNCNEKDASQYIVIYSFINGKSIDQTLVDGKIDNKLIVAIAKKIRKMHDLTQDKNMFNLPKLSFDSINKRNTMLHFDLTKSNIFLTTNNEISIIDFDDARYGSAIYDISILITLFFFSKSRGVDINGMNIFLDTYYEDNNSQKKEIKLIKKCSLQWLDYLISNGKLSEDLLDTFKGKRALIIENL